MLPRSCPVSIDRIDGREVESAWGDSTVIVEFLPGSHVIEVSYYADYGMFGPQRRGKDRQELQLDTKPGRRYQLKWTTGGDEPGEWWWKPYIMDVTEQEILQVDGKKNELYSLR